MTPKDVLQPITDLFTGADGGVGFARLYHALVPQLIELAAAGNPQAQQRLNTITEFSRICGVCLK